MGTAVQRDDAVRVHTARKEDDAVGLLNRTDGGVTVDTAWSRTRGWAGGREALGLLLAERGVRAPW